MIKNGFVIEPVKVMPSLLKEIDLETLVVKMKTIRDLIIFFNLVTMNNEICAINVSAS